MDTSYAQKTLLVLKEARAKIAKPENWTKGYYARDEEGRPTASRSNEACRWCVYGAVQATQACWTTTQEAERMLDSCAEASGFACAAQFNDHGRTLHADVLSLFDRAIAKAEALAIAKAEVALR